MMENPVLSSSIPAAAFKQIHLLVILPILLLGYRLLSTFGQRRKSYPPGPPTLPIIGNANCFPRKDIPQTFAKWAREYGDVVSVQVFNQTVIGIHSPSLVKHVFETHKWSNTNRPVSTVSDLISPDGLNFGTARYADDKWKAFRKVSEKMLSTSNLHNYEKLQQAEGVQLLMDLLADPENWLLHTNRFTTSFFMAMIFGTRGPKVTSPAIQDFRHVHRRFMQALDFASAPIIDLFPILKWVPECFAGWKREAREINRLQYKLFEGLTKQARTRLETGQANGCFMEYMIKHWETCGFKDEGWLINLGGTLLEGSDTTSAVIKNVIVAAGSCPSKQALASEELQRVVGPDRLPQTGDLEKLPYTRAFLNETMRWLIVAPIGVPHEMTRDEIIDGFLYPKGSVVFQNTWFMFHDERYFDKPFEFIPERFLENAHGVRPDIEDDPARRDQFLFGGGRRVCPGSASAKRTLEVVAPFLLWAFEFQPGIANAAPQPDFNMGLLSTNKIDCKIVPRSDRHVKTIQREFSKATEELKRWE